MKNKKQNKPKVSVLMPVYNAERYLSDAIESVLAQTLSDFELICVDDGSADKSYSILRKFAKKDKRVRVYKNKVNSGIGYTRKRLVDLSVGQYLAIMDADDVMIKDRLEKQVAYLESNPDVIVVGGQCVTINERGEIAGTKQFPTAHAEIYKLMYVRMSMQQPATMLNCELIPADFPWYDNSVSPVEDLDNLFRLFNYGEFANLEDYVLFYRVYPTSSSLKNPKRTYNLTRLVRKRAVEKYGYEPTFSAQVINLVQYVVAKLVPNILVFPLYIVFRNVTDGIFSWFGKRRVKGVVQEFTVAR